MPKKKPSTGRPHSRRQLSIREVRRQEPNLEKIAGTLAALAIAQAEKEAEQAARVTSKDRHVD
jgi:hypothetical protein